MNRAGLLGGGSSGSPFGLPPLGGSDDDKLSLSSARTGSTAAGRVTQSLKDPRGYAEFQRYNEEHSARGLANTQRGVQAKRPTIYQLGPKLKKAKLPLLIIAGDEDDNCVEPGVFLKQTCPNARLWICPGTGHTVNTEEPALFNLMLAEFLAHRIRTNIRRLEGALIKVASYSALTSKPLDLATTEMLLQDVLME